MQPVNGETIFCDSAFNIGQPSKNTGADVHARYDCWFFAWNVAADMSPPRALKSQQYQ